MDVELLGADPVGDGHAGGKPTVAAVQPGPPSTVSDPPRSAAASRSSARCPVWRGRRSCSETPTGIRSVMTARSVALPTRLAS
jgi:hypothetical protein